MSLNVSGGGTFDARIKVTSISYFVKKQFDIIPPIWKGDKIVIIFAKSGYLLFVKHRNCISARELDLYDFTIICANTEILFLCEKSFDL